MKQSKLLIGIDEVGRGPLAGPVMVGAVCVASDFDWSTIPGVNDSKQLSPRKRRMIFDRAKELQRQGRLDFAVAAVSARRIDTIGIVPAIKEALEEALIAVVSSTVVTDESAFQIKLDGGLKAPASFLRQETIIKGDAKEPVIGLASIVAKVTRDFYMERLSVKKDFLEYQFAAHKGYGTRRHREVIATLGLSSEHRATFCRNIVLPQKGPVLKEGS